MSIRANRTLPAVAAAAAFTAALSAMLATPALAVGSNAGPAPGLSAVNPGPTGYFDFAEAPGATKTVALVVHNLSNSTQTYRIYPTDATTSPATGVQYGERETPAVGVGAWLRPSTELLTLGPEQTAEVTVSVTVPAGVLPGDHVGGIAAENVRQPAAAVVAGRNGASAQLITTTRVILAVVVRTPGPAAVGMQLGSPRLGTVNGARQFVQFPMNDTGLLLFKPTLRSVVTACAGGPAVLNIDRQLDTFVPRTAIAYDYYLQQNLPAGCYRATSEVLDGTVLLSQVSSRFSVSSAQAAVQPSRRQGAAPGSKAVPTVLLLLLGIAVLLLVVVLLLLLLLLGRRRRDRERVPTSVPYQRYGAEAPVKVGGRHRG